MNGWEFLTCVGNKLWTHGTRLLGIAQGTVAIIASMDGLIPPSHLKYYLGASAVLTYWRGQTNANTIADKVAAKIQTSEKP